MYENSRFLKNRFTFCGVNTNFGQQWAPPAYYHLTPIASKGKHWDCFGGWLTWTFKVKFTIKSLSLSHFELLWCQMQILMSGLSTRVNTKTIFELLSSVLSIDYNFGQILGKLIPNSRPYTAITSCRAPKL